MTLGVTSPMGMVFSRHPWVSHFRGGHDNILNVSCLKEQAMPLEIFRGSVSYVDLTLKVADRLENEMGGLTGLQTSTSSHPFLPLPELQCV